MQKPVPSIKQIATGFMLYIFFWLSFYSISRRDWRKNILACLETIKLFFSSPQSAVLNPVSRTDEPEQKETFGSNIEHLEVSEDC